MEKEQKIDLAKIIISAACFAGGLVTGWIWFYILAYAISGYKTIIEAVSGIIHGELLDETFLMTIASIGAIYCDAYAEAVAVMLFYAVGEFFEDFAVDNSRESISNLMDIKAEFANKIVNGSEVTVKPEELVIGDIIIIKPGEKIPVDGKVIDGSSSIDTAALTGESIPRDVAVGDEIVSGTINLTGALNVEVTTPYEDSTVSKVLDLVENASDRKAPIENFITKFAHVYTPIVVGLAAAVAVIPTIVFGWSSFYEWIYRAMIFLIISCPCALVISVPLSMFAGVGAASKQGILVKGSNYLQALSNVSTFAFDKTGTLTTGRFDVTGIHGTSSITDDELLAMAAACESKSTHPIAVSIVQRQKQSVPGQQIAAVDEYQEIPGVGVSCIYNGKKVYCGNSKLMERQNIHYTKSVELGSAVYLSDEENFLGYIVVADRIRVESKEMLKELRDLGVAKELMLTGDRKEIAKAVADEVGVTDVMYELMPAQKVEAVENAIDQNTGKGRVVFVGDGINDAPVLARADVGIAMGAFGSDAAIEAADVVIMTDDIGKLPKMIRIARKTLKICRENVTFALAVKFAVMILGAFGLATMWEAVFADVGVTIIAICNSMRALRY